MTQIAYGLLFDTTGLAGKTVLEQGPTRPELRFKAWSTPSAALRSVQDPCVPVDREHDGVQVGRVISLQRRGTNTWCVAELDDHVTPTVDVRVGDELRSVETAMWWSASRIGSEQDGFLLDSVSLTSRPARVSPGPPLVFRRGDAYLAARNAPIGSFEHTLLTKAAEYRPPGDPLFIVDDQPPGDMPFVTARSVSTVEVRSASLADVSVDKREIVALVAPYERPAPVTIRGRDVREMFAVGCFDRVVEQTNTIRLNFDHVMSKVVGRAVGFDVGRSDGLVTTFRVANTRRGDEALELAAEDCVDCSVGFAAVRESWPQPDLRLVREGWIDHVGLTAAPAYRDARVLAVRGDALI